MIGVVLMLILHYFKIFTSPNEVIGIYVYLNYFCFLFINTRIHLKNFESFDGNFGQ